MPQFVVPFVFIVPQKHQIFLGEESVIPLQLQLPYILQLPHMDTSFLYIHPSALYTYFHPLTFTFHHHTRHNAKGVYLGYCFCLMTISEGGHNHLTEWQTELEEDVENYSVDPEDLEAI